MKALVQRVTRCSVSINQQENSSIGEGMLILLGIKTSDTTQDAEYLAAKCAALRIFEDRQGKMNLSIQEVQGAVMVVSQFTLYGDTRKGNRPNYTEAAPPDLAERLYEEFIQRLVLLLGKERVSSGVFRAMMDVTLVNTGPVTVMVESKN